MSKLMFIVALIAMAFIGYLYLIERDQVAATRTAVTAAANDTAAALSKASAPEHTTDADAESAFRRALPPSYKFDDIAVRQRVEPVTPDRFRQFVTVFGRARTGISEFFNMQGAEIEVVATRDFERAK